MRLYQDLEYVGEDAALALFGKSLWHCTSLVIRLETKELQYVVQQPLMHNGTVMGYSNLNSYVLTKEEIIKNFKIINDDGNLKDIDLNKSKEYKKELKKLEEEFNNLTDEEFNTIILE